MNEERLVRSLWRWDSVWIMWVPPPEVVRLSLRTRGIGSATKYETTFACC